MQNITIDELLRTRTHPLLSLEFFPPKTHFGFGLLGGAIERMKHIRPDFVSVTYGAGGTTHERSLVACELLRRMGFGPVVAHLTCTGASRTDLLKTIDEFYDDGFRNIMALRGDPQKGQDRFSTTPDGLMYACDLVKLLKERHQDLCCGVAGYPETHPEAESPADDIIHLKEKLTAGGTFVTTQLFFDNKFYFDYVARCRAAGITQPIIPGLMPAVSLKQMKKVVELSSSSFPEELADAMEAAGGEGPIVEAIGMAWTIKQIDELLKNGAPGIHLYILNRDGTATTPALIKCLDRWR